MKINFKEKPKVWDKFVDGSPQRSIFVYTKFLNLLGVKYDLVTCLEDGKIVAGTIIIYKSGKPIDGVFPFTEYQGLQLADNSHLANHSRISYELKVSEFFIRELADHYKSLCLCNSWRLCDLRAFQWHNYHQASSGIFDVGLRYGSILILKKYADFDDYLATIRTLRKREIKKARKCLTINESKDEKVLIKLYRQTFARQGIKVNKEDIDLVRSICKGALKGGFGRLIYAKLNNLTIAANLFLFDNRTGYYLIGASDPKYRNFGGGTLLMINAIENTFSRGLEEVDFVGANSPTRGDYKLSFNGDLKPYFVANYPKEKDNASHI